MQLSKYSSYLVNSFVLAQGHKYGTHSEDQIHDSVVTIKQ